MPRTMFGHGSPHTIAARAAQTSTAAASRARRWRRTVARGLIVCVGWLSAPAIAAPAELSNEPVRLRIRWGGGEATQWSGQIAVDQGVLADLHVVELTPDAAGSIWLNDKHVAVQSLSAHTQDAVAVTAFAGGDAKLGIDLAAPTVPAAIHAQVPLSDLSREPYELKLDERGNTLTVEKLAAEPLQIIPERESLIFQPGERCTFEIRAALAQAAPGTKLDIATTLTAENGNELQWSDQQRLSVPPDKHATLAITVPMPSADGVYRVRLVAQQPAGFVRKFGPGSPAPLAERKFDVVVVSTTSSAADQDAQWEEVLQLDPTHPRWWDRLPAWTRLHRIPGLKPGALGSTRTATSVDHPLGRFVELSPAAANSEPHWQAYAVPLEATGEPHLLELDYPATEEQQFNVTLIEPTEAGEQTTTICSSGVFVEGLGRSELKRIQTLRVVFWPRTQAPLMLLTNQHPTAPTRFGTIRVFKRTGNQLTSRRSGTTLADRLVAAYVARPLEGYQFGSERSPARRQGIDNPYRTATLSTLYTSATRLADYVHYAGYNSAVVAVPGSQHLQPLVTQQPSILPVHDAADSLPEPDGLELLLRVFDREQLAMIPALSLMEPIPALEALRRESDPQTSGLEWVGSDGRTWLASRGTRQGRAPYYNLLNPRVQQEILRGLTEFLDRYGHHPALRGLAVQLSSDGYAQLPSLEWGLDDATMSHFSRSTGLALNATGPGRFAERFALLSRTDGQYAVAWRAWRAKRVAEFYRQLAGLLQSKNNKWRLMLTTEQALDGPDLVVPDILNQQLQVGATLHELGLDLKQIAAIPGVVICPTSYVEPTTPLRDHSISLVLNDEYSAQRRQASPGEPVAAVLYHRPLRHKLTSFAAKCPFPVAQDSEFVSQAIAYGTAVRAPYAQTLADADCHVLLDGGERPALGQEDVLRDTRTIVQRLPVGVPTEQLLQQPVLVRTYQEADAVTVLVVNTCPWTTEARIAIDTPRAAVLEPLGDTNSTTTNGTAGSTTLMPGGAPWTLSLEPYAIYAVRIADGNVRVTAVDARPSDAAKVELANRLEELSERDKTPRIYSSLTNPSCERIGNEPLPGWRLLANPGVAAAVLDDTTSHDGTTSLHLRSNGPLARLESNAFPTPPTGQFAMTVFLRGRNLAPNSELFIAVEVDRDGPTYRRAIVVGGPRSGALPITENWAPYPLLVNTVPLQSQGQTRVRFELSGAGEVWIDEIKTYDLLFPLSFYRHAGPEWIVFVKLIGAAKDAYHQGQVTDCLRYLEGYWPRFLAAYTPLNQPRVARQPAPAVEAAPPPAENPPEKEGPSFSEKLNPLRWFR